MIRYSVTRNNPTTTIIDNEAFEGETIEQKMDRIINNDEPITDGAPTIFTERKDGVIPAYNIRTDKWEHAVEGMDYVSREAIAKGKGSLQPIKGGLTEGDGTTGQSIAGAPDAGASNGGSEG